MVGGSQGGRKGKGRRATKTSLQGPPFMNLQKPQVSSSSSSPACCSVTGAPPEPASAGVPGSAPDRHGRGVDCEVDAYHKLQATYMSLPVL